MTRAAVFGAGSWGTAFAQVLADAVQALIADGSYEDVLAKWGVEDGAIDTPMVNPAAG